MRAVVVTMFAVVCFCVVSCDRDEQTAATPGSGDPRLGEQAIHTHGCGSCHTIPGIRGADALVGPSLDRVGGRSYIGGVLPNTQENLARWIQNPPAIDPKTAMPNLHVSEADAHDIAGYLSTLR